MGAAGSIKSLQPDGFSEEHRSSQASGFPNAAVRGSPHHANELHSNIINSPKYVGRSTFGAEWGSDYQIESKSLKDSKTGIDLDDLDLNINLDEEADDQETIDISFVEVESELEHEVSMVSSSRTLQVDEPRLRVQNTSGRDSRRSNPQYSEKLLGEHLQEASCVHSLLSGEVVSGGADRTLRFFDPLPLLGSSRGCEGSQWGSREMDCIAIGGDNAEVLAIVELVPCHLSPSPFFAESDLSYLVTGSQDCCIRIWSSQAGPGSMREADAQSGRARPTLLQQQQHQRGGRWGCVGTLQGHQKAVLCLATYCPCPPPSAGPPSSANLSAEDGNNNSNNSNNNSSSKKGIMTHIKEFSLSSPSFRRAPAAADSSSSSYLSGTVSFAGFPTSPSASAPLSPSAGPSLSARGAGSAEPGGGQVIVSGSADHTLRLWGRVVGAAGPSEAAPLPPSSASWACFRVLRGHRGTLPALSNPNLFT